MGNPFRASNRNRMGSNTLTDKNQGGGEKKAGFPYQIGRTSWTQTFMHQNIPRGQCCKLSQMQQVLFPLAHQSRSIGSDVRVAGAYWHVPRT
jgi:hypothetical protein